MHSWFSLVSLCCHKPTDNIWYKNQPVGINTLGNFMKRMAKAAKISGKKTNNSAWKTMIKWLVKENVNPLHVAQLSGHKNLKSLDSYSSASVEQQKSMSLIIRGQQPCTSTKTVMNPPLHSSAALGSGLSGNTTILFLGMLIAGDNTAYVYFSQQFTPDMHVYISHHKSAKEH